MIKLEKLKRERNRLLVLAKKKRKMRIKIERQKIIESKLKEEIRKLNSEARTDFAKQVKTVAKKAAIRGKNIYKHPATKKAIRRGKIILRNIGTTAEELIGYKK